MADVRSAGLAEGETTPGGPAGQPLADLGKRTVVGLGLAVAAIVALAVGGILWWLIAAAIGLGMLWEWAGLAKVGPIRLVIALVALAAALLLAAPFGWDGDRSTVAALVGFALLVAIVTNSGRLGFGLAYAGLPAIALLYLRAQPVGFWLALWTMAVVWATDIGAYFAGRRLGGPLLAPTLSPKKTWSGLIGGAVAALIAGAVLAVAVGLPEACRWLGFPLALLAQAGDIYESALKRRAGVKDSSGLLPGHGGLLDRLDGLVPVAVLVAALVANGNLGFSG